MSYCIFGAQTFFDFFRCEKKISAKKITAEMLHLALVALVLQINRMFLLPEVMHLVTARTQPPNITQVHGNDFNLFKETYQSPVSSLH